MPLFPFDDPRRRRRSPFLTPPINPEMDMSGDLADAVPELPDLPPNPRPILPPSSSIPRGVEPPPIRRPSRYEELGEARDVYLKGTPGRARSALTGALQGLAAGGPGGALTGAAYGALDPRRVREVEFNQRVRPQIFERFGFEDQQRAAQRQTEQDALNAEYRRAQTGAANRSNQPRLATPPRPISSPRGVYDPATGRIISGTEPLPRQEAPEYSSSSQGIYSRKTGQVTTPAPQKPTRPPGAAYERESELADLKQDAQLAWEKWGQTPEGPDKEAARVKATKAQETYNAAVERFGGLFGEHFETGRGVGNWNYYKPRQGRGMLSAPQQGGRQATVSIDAVRAYATEKGIDEQEALQRFQRKGLKVRQ